ncbi:MAG: hypothetical protein ABEI77_09275 [Halorientalis sp.]
MTSDSDRSIDRRDVTRVVGSRLHAVGKAVFGDRLGLVIFLLGLTFVMTYWRIGIFLTDSYAIANTLVNVADGHLAITRIVYSLNYGSQPGLWVAHGSIYGRNYGHVVVSVPVLWLLDALAVLFDPRLVLAGAWSGLVVILADQTGRLIDRRRPFVIGGCSVALLSFFGSVIVATPLDDKWLAFVALQITAMVATALVGVGLYRLLGSRYGRRVGAVAGIAAVVATPVGFWAAIPKRHVFSALTVVVVLAGFYLARERDSPRRALVARTVPYAGVALLTWIHAMEGLIVFVALVPLDLLTARSNHPRTLATVAVVFLLALTPFLATNYFISGSPIEPPRLLDSYHGQVKPPGAGTGAETPTPTATGTATPTPTNETGTGTPTASGRSPPTGSSPGGGSPLSPLISLVSVLAGVFATIVDSATRAANVGSGFLSDGVALLTSQPERLYYTFVRSGRIPVNVNYRVNAQEAIELTMLETTPLVAGLAGTIAVGARWAVSDPSLAAVRADLDRPIRQTDLLAVLIAVLFVVMNLRRLPLHTQITVRYLVPLYPLGIYGVARVPAVRRVIERDWRWLGGVYLATVVAGGIGLLVVNRSLSLALGEAMQLHALLGLTSALPLAAWALVAGLRPRVDTRVGAVVLAIPAALATLFLLCTGFVYFQYGQYALPLGRLVANWLPVAV